MPPPRYPSDLSDEERVILEPLLRAGPKSAAVLPSTHPAGRQRCVLPSEEHLLVVHVALRVPPVAGRLLPLPQAAPRGSAQARARPAVGDGAQDGQA